ncbi:Sugar phosphate isomerase/epimerase [Parapedobacter koreensis]|uniref:Sugar phosphate isomerase/epimerase n=2 Tax=Parapedobacter koreensis TaxID=332977 RepID=A0A1H7UIF5_9SPHI|nr:Sugar phosphate isomerase/epimerase [Parapedobacter koreensis]
MYRYMKVGLVHFMAFPTTMRGNGPVLETIRALATDDYFNAIEITTIADREERQQAKRILETSHMTIAYGAQPRLLTAGLNINDLDEERRKEALTVLFDGVDEAYEMGASGFAFLSGKYDEENKEQAFGRLVESTKEICRYAKSKGDLKVVLEIFDYDVDKKSLIGPASLALRYVEEVRKECDNFGLMVDLSHIPLLHETIEEAILPIKDYIVHAHIGNCVVKDPALEGYGDQHPRFGFPNSENDVDEVADYLTILLDIGFLNKEHPPIVSFEIKPYGDEDPYVVIANAKRTLNEAWARL